MFGMSSTLRNLGSAKEKSEKRSDQTFEGHLDGVKDGCLYGWARNTEDHAERAKVNVYLNGKTIGDRIPCALPRKDIEEAFGEGSHFAFELPLDPKEFKIGTNSISVKFAGTEIQLKNSPISFNFEEKHEAQDSIGEPHRMTAVSLSEIDWNVESVGAKGISGWIWIPAAPTRRIVVELLENGTVLAQGVADRYRGDLEAAKKSDGHCAFEIAAPPALLDGLPHHVELRVSGQKQSFFTGDACTFARPVADFDLISPFSVIGSVRLDNGSAETFAIEILLDGKTVHSGETDALKRFAWTADPDLFTFGVDMSSRPRTLALTCLVNRTPVLEDRLEIVSTPGSELALHLEEVSSHRLAGRALAVKTGVDRVKILVGEAVVADLECRPDCAFDIDLGTLKPSNGRCEIRIQPVTAEGKPLAPFVRSLDYQRWWVDLDLLDDQLRGKVSDAWDSTREVAIELLIDGVPVSVATARPSLDGDGSSSEFSFGLSNRWRDGRAHSVQVRILGTDRLWPRRALLFKAGEAGSNATARVERLENEVVGFALLPWAPEAITEVELRAGERVLDRQRADRETPVLRAEGLIPEERGFSFDVPLEVKEPLAVRALHNGNPVFEQTVTAAPAAFTLQDAGYGHEGACFVLPDPFATSIGREEARAVLFAASAFRRASSLPLTIVLTSAPDQPDRRGIDLLPLVKDLVGEANAHNLAGARFVRLVDPVLPSTATGTQHLAYSLDLWLRACAFSLILGPSRGGILAYCAMSRREGLLPGGTQIAVLVDELSVTDRIGRDHFLDDPTLLVTEALERAAIRSADHLLGHAPDSVDKIESVAPKMGPHVAIEAAEIGPLRLQPLQGNIDGGRQWLIFAGPLTLRSGLVVFCDAIDRLARRPGVDPEKLGILFIGPEDWVRGRMSGQYIRDRARKWPFALRLCLDLTFDSAASVMADYAPVGHGVVLPMLEGTPWHTLLSATGIAPVAVDRSRPDNATDLANTVQQALAATESPVAAPRTENRMGPILAELASQGVPAPAPVPDDADLPTITVCITHFNRPTLLRQTLASLRACDYPKLDVVIVDDGSPAAGVAEELTEIEAEFADIGIRLYSQPNAYLGAARNAAAKQAKGEFIVFMDDDNLAHPGMLHGFVAAQRATEADIVTSRFGYFDGTDDIDPGTDVPRRLGVPLMPDPAVGVFANCFGDANMLIRRSAFESLGGFTEDFGRGHEDWEFFARAQMAGLSHTLSNRVLFWYREAAQSMLLGRESETFDHLRNIRAYSEHLPPEIYRVVMLAQGLIRRWDKPPADMHKPARPGLAVARRLAYGRVAVVMRTKDRAILLERAIDSVLQQTFTDWALVVVNDGGDPRPVQELLDSRKDQLQGRSLLINNPTSTGMENASNAGITASASEFIVIHDDDDAWAPTFLERCVDRLDGSPPEIGGVVTQTTVVIEDIEDGRVIERERFPFANIEAVELARLAVENQFPPISFLFRRSALETVGSFDGRLPVLGDWDFHLRMAQHYPISVLHETLAFYHHRTAGVTNQYGNTVVAQKETHRRQRAEYINRHIRDTVGQCGQGSEGTMLLAGEMHRVVSEKLTSMHDHLQWLEKLLNDEREHMLYLEKLIDDRQK